MQLKEGRLTALITSCKTRHWRKDRSDGKTRKKRYAATGWSEGNAKILETERKH